MSKWNLLIPAVALCTVLAACDRTPSPEAPMTTEAKGAPADETSPASNPTAVPVQAEPARASVVATQPGPNGSQVDLVKAAVVGNLLTVQLSYRASPDASLYEHIPVDQISVIDDSTSERYSVVKDASARYMALPLASDGKRVHVNVGSSSSGQVSLKFPAPPPTSQTVSISIPEVGPFDGVAIQR